MLTSLYYRFACRSSPSSKRLEIIPYMGDSRGLGGEQVVGEPLAIAAALPLLPWGQPNRSDFRKVWFRTKTHTSHFGLTPKQTQRRTYAARRYPHTGGSRKPRSHSDGALVLSLGPQGGPLSGDQWHPCGWKSRQATTDGHGGLIRDHDPAAAGS